MASLQTFLWLTQTVALMPVYPETADPTEKIPQPTKVPITHSSQGGPASHRRKSMGDSSAVPRKSGCDEWGFWLPWESAAYFVGN